MASAVRAAHFCMNIELSVNLFIRTALTHIVLVPNGSLRTFSSNNRARIV